LNRELSLYLDLWRFSAALVVFLGHVSGARFTGGLLWQLGPYMGQAVAIFFVLSGFVIGYAVDRREASARDYVVARAARIYSVALPALLLTFALDAVGRMTRPDLYSIDWGYVADGRAWQFFCGLLFINQIWSWNVSPGSNLPYWSMGFEVWYYVLFGIAVFAPRPWRVPALLVVLLFVGPRIASLFPLWLLGLAGYQICARHLPGRRVGAALFFGSVAIWIGYEASISVHDRLQFPGTGLPRYDGFLENYLVGMLFLLHVIGFRAVSDRAAPLLAPLVRPIRWVAGATFTVYLFHLPVAQFVAAQMPWPPDSWASRTALLGGTAAALFAIAEFTERRKMVWRRGIELVIRPTPRRA
jgi:peptidoglycan/LPS O-acetylase OafA/YrhL